MSKWRHWKGIVVMGSKAPEIEGVWTDDDDWLIDNHGWRIGTNTDGLWTIRTTRSGLNFFLTDRDANDFVQREAENGSELHRRAMACVAARNMGISTDE